MQHHPAVARKIHLSQLFRFAQPPLTEQVKTTMEYVEELTLSCTRLQLNIAVDYGGQDEIVRVMRNVSEMSREGRLQASDID